MEFCAYDAARHAEAAHQIWRETGWLSSKEEEATMDLFVGACEAHVAEVNGQAECLVAHAPGDIRYLQETLPFSGIMSVTTSRVARKQGLAKRLTARVVAASAAEGAMVSGLGMFEQGFYNQLGFGSGGYEHWIGFDPARLRVDVHARLPQRITPEDWAAVHASLVARRRGHGSVAFANPDITHAEMQWTKDGFGLGYHDGPNGELTHHLWVRPRGEHGPYSIRAMSYQTLDQFLELMALVRNLGDQVRLVSMREPPGIQLQDLIEQPFKQYQISEKSQFEAGARAQAYWQVRILDLAGCLGRTHLPHGSARFNLALTDPIAGLLDEDASWRGVGGEYAVELGEVSSVVPGTQDTLPTLRASVGAFTRLWLGICPATGLSATDDLSGPDDLLAALDRVLVLPRPLVDWDF